MRSIILRLALGILAAFVAVSAIAGAVWVVPTMPLDWIKAGPFTDWTIPAIALGLVGAFGAVTAVVVAVRPWVGALMSVVAGATLVTFELVEVGVVGWTLTEYGTDTFQAWLQLVYLVIGTAQIAIGAALWWLTRESAPRIPILHPAT
jgi:hypothetical protein